MRKKIETKDAPAAPGILSQAIVNGDTIYLSGQIHNKADGTMVEGSVSEKLAQIMSNIKAILEAADASVNDIVKVVVYVTDMAQMPELNEHYGSYFSDPLPAREAVCVKELPLGATIEISVIACK